MPGKQNIIAVIFDFDDTLTDDSTSLLLAKHDIDAARFWKEDVDRLVTEEGWEPSLAYLHLLVQFMEAGKLPKFTNRDLQEFGRTLEPYPGLQVCLRDLRKIARSEGFEVEFYIVSGGLQDVVQGFRLRSEFKAVWGAQLAPEKPGGPVKYVKRAITFTEKTRYLFIINKGIDGIEADKRPYLVNKDVAEQDRRVPFKNMIYIGDGLSDIPCFSVIQKRAEGDRGIAFGVFQPGDEKSARRAWFEIVFPQRTVGGVHPPMYGRNQALGSLLRTAVATRCADIKLRRT